MERRAPAKRDKRWVPATARLLGPLLDRWFEPEVRGLERIPDGPALVVSNHSGGFMSPDTWILGRAIVRARGLDELPSGLAHDQVMRAPLVGSVLRHLGVAPASEHEAHRIFAEGGKVLVYPGGDLDAFRSSRERDRVVFGPRRGYVRLALRERVPIVPVVAAGSHEGFWVLTDGRWLASRFDTHRRLRTDVLPITFSFPWGLSPGWPYLPLPTRILVEVLPAIRFERDGAAAAEDDAWVEACHERVRGAMQSALERLASERRRRGRYVLPWRRARGERASAPPPPSKRT